MTPRTRLREVPAFTTLDRSEIRELMHPRTHGNANQSLAQATVPPRARTVLHRHHRSEEVYHLQRGRGVMTLGDETFDVDAGDTVVIVPGTPHRIANESDEPLVLLCACSPPYSDDDTELLDPARE